jgi:hypothetical protein
MKPYKQNVTVVEYLEEEEGQGKREEYSVVWHTVHAMLRLMYIDGEHNPASQWE